MVFSDPGTAQEAIQNGTYDDWFNVVNDPRYIIQQLKRARQCRGPAAEDVARIENEARTADFEPANPGEVQGLRLPPKKKNRTKKDWSVALGAGFPMTAVYPATWSASFTTASCATDYAAYVTGVAGSSSNASILGYNNLYAGGCAGTAALTYWAYNTGGTATTSPALSADGTQIAFVQGGTLVLLKWSSTGGAFSGTTSSSSKNVTVASGTCNLVIAGEPIYGPTIAASTTIASCSGTTLVLSANGSGSGSGEPIAFNNQFTGTLSSGSKIVTAFLPGRAPLRQWAQNIRRWNSQGDTVAGAAALSLA